MTVDLDAPTQNDGLRTKITVDGRWPGEVSVITVNKEFGRSSRRPE